MQNDEASSEPAELAVHSETLRSPIEAARAELDKKLAELERRVRAVRPANLIGRLRDNPQVFVSIAICVGAGVGLIQNSARMRRALKVASGRLVRKLISEVVQAGLRHYVAQH